MSGAAPITRRHDNGMTDAQMQAAIEWAADHQDKDDDAAALFWAAVGIGAMDHPRLAYEQRLEWPGRERRMVRAAELALYKARDHFALRIHQRTAGITP